MFPARFGNDPTPTLHIHTSVLKTASSQPRQKNPTTYFKIDDLQKQKQKKRTSAPLRLQPAQPFLTTLLALPPRIVETIHIIAQPSFDRINFILTE